MIDLNGDISIVGGKNSKYNRKPIHIHPFFSLLRRYISTIFKLNFLVRLEISSVKNLSRVTE